MISKFPQKSLKKTGTMIFSVSEDSNEQTDMWLQKLSYHTDGFTHAFTMFTLY